MSLGKSASWVRTVARLFCSEGEENPNVNINQLTGQRRKDKRDHSSLKDDAGIIQSPRWFYWFYRPLCNAAISHNIPLASPTGWEVVLKVSFSFRSPKSKRLVDDLILFINLVSLCVLLTYRLRGGDGLVGKLLYIVNGFITLRRNPPNIPSSLKV